jgi:hypothetical protein
MIHIDSKITVWDRFSIADEHEESLLEFLHNNPMATASDILQWASDSGIDGEHSTLIETGAEMTPEENDGASTIEVIRDPQENLLWENAPIEEPPVGD